VVTVDRLEQHWFVGQLAMGGRRVSSTRARCWRRPARFHAGATRRNVVDMSGRRVQRRQPLSPFGGKSDLYIALYDDYSTATTSCRHAFRLALARQTDAMRLFIAGTRATWAAGRTELANFPVRGGPPG